MSFIRTMEEIRKNSADSSDFFDAEMLAVIYETKPEVVKKLLPKPLKPAADPLALMFIAKYPKTSFGEVYNETALFLLCKHRRNIGAYCLAMHVTSDIAMAGGREFFGYPKKMADIHFERKDNKFTGWAERKGVRYLEINATILRDATKEEVSGFIWRDYKTTWNVYNFKHFPNPRLSGFDYWPRLIKERVTFERKTIELAETDVKLQQSEFDPWQEVEIIKIVESIYTTGDNYMLKGKTVAVVNPLSFAPHAFLKWD